MATKAIEQEMYNYFMQLNPEEQKSVVQMIRTFLKGKKKTESLEKTSPITIEQYNKELDEAMDSRANGNYITIEEMEAKAEKW